MTLITTVQNPLKGICVAFVESGLRFRTRFRLEEFMDTTSKALFAMQHEINNSLIDRINELQKRFDTSLDIIEELTRRVLKLEQENAELKARFRIGF